jgi:hypothetical protein
MKYVIFSIVIAAILAIISLFTEEGNKTDKYFLYTIAVLLILSGVYFSYKSEKDNKTEATEQGEKLDSTLTNTEDLLSTTSIVIMNLDKSLKNVSKLSSNIDTLSEVLNKVESDLKKQIKTVKNTLTQTKKFQELVDEQNQRASKRFELENAKFKIRSSDVVFFKREHDSIDYSLQFKIVNNGKRFGDLISYNDLILFTDKNLKINNIINYGENIVNTNLAGDSKELYTSITIKKFKEEFIHNTIDLAYYIIKIKYQDESDKKIIEETFFFKWLGYKVSGLKFSMLKPENQNIVSKALRDNNLEFILVN